MVTAFRGLTRTGEGVVKMTSRHPVAGHSSTLQCFKASACCSSVVTDSLELKSASSLLSQLISLSEISSLLPLSGPSSPQSQRFHLSFQLLELSSLFSTQEPWLSSLLSLPTPSFLTFLVLAASNCRFLRRDISAYILQNNCKSIENRQILHLHGWGLVRKRPCLSAICVVSP